MNDQLELKSQWLGYGDFYWNRFSPRVGTISSAANPNRWTGGFVAYIGYPTKAKATEAMKYLLKHQKAEDVEIRKAKRIKYKGIRWELKVWGLALEEVFKLVDRDSTSTATTAIKTPATNG